VFSFIKSLFGTNENNSKVVERAADGIYNGLDKLIYTEEEKADAFQKGREAFLEFVKITHDQNSIRSVTRRWLAFLVIAPVMLFFVMSGLTKFVGIFVSNSVQYTEAADFLFKLVVEMSPWAAGILAFYFGSHILSKLPGNR